MDELRLMETKWFDYRVLAPEQATLCFIYEYARARRAYHARLGDGAWINFLKDFTPSQPCDWKHWKALNGTRQFADSLCVPYSLFWQLALEAHTKANLSHFYPNAFSNARFRRELELLLAEYAKDFVITSEAKMFRASEYRGYRVQDLYYSYLLRAIAAKYRGPALSGVLADLVESGRMSVDFLKTLG